jgi:hypothetical protein
MMLIDSGCEEDDDGTVAKDNGNQPIHNNPPAHKRRLDF